MYCRSIVILIRIETRIPGAGITLWMFLLDGQISSISLHWVKSYWTESQFISTWLFSEHPLGTKEPYRTPAWLSDIWLCVALMKYYFIFGVCDGRKWLKTLYYLFQTICVFCLLPIYCSVRLLCFYSERQAKWNWYQSARSLYRFLISLIRAELICAVELLLCGDRAIFEFGMYLCWIEGTQTLSYVHNAESTNVTYVIVSSSYSAAKCSIRNTSTVMDVHFFKHTAAGKSLFSTVFLKK